MGPMPEQPDGYSLPPAALMDLVEHSFEGMAWVDDNGITQYMNDSAARLLGSTRSALVGADAWYMRHDAQTKDFDVRVSNVGLGTLVHLNDGRPARRERQLAAFATTSAAIAREPKLSNVLDQLAEIVCSTATMATCALVLMDGPDDDVRYVGRSGLPPDYVERFDASRRNGAFSVTAEAFRTARPVIALGTRARVLADERWSPAHGLLTGNNWDAFVAVPLVVRGRAIGALNGFYQSGHEPDTDDVRFLSLMANHAAVAIDNARMLASLKLRAADAERVRLAGDLHDSVSQALFSLTLQAKSLEMRSTSAPDSPATETDLRELRELAQHALSEMRSLIQFRRPAELRDENLLKGLERLAASFQQRAGLAVSVRSEADPLPAMDEYLEDDLFRLVQEALNNIVKHAGASRADVVLRVRAGLDLVAEVVDDGRGMSDMGDDSAGFGMSTMRERAERHGGQLSIDSTDAGTAVRVVVPNAFPNIPPTEETP